MKWQTAKLGPRTGSVLGAAALTMILATSAAAPPAFADEGTALCLARQQASESAKRAQANALEEAKSEIAWAKTLVLTLNDLPVEAQEQYVTEENTRYLIYMNSPEMPASMRNALGIPANARTVFGALDEGKTTPFADRPAIPASPDGRVPAVPSGQELLDNAMNGYTALSKLRVSTSCTVTHSNGTTQAWSTGGDTAAVQRETNKLNAAIGALRAEVAVFRAAEALRLAKAESDRVQSAIAADRAEQNRATTLYEAELARRIPRIPM